MAGSKAEPVGRFKRMWMEVEVEIRDEDALRAFDLQTVTDTDGNVTGLLDTDLNERVGQAVSAVVWNAFRAARPHTGVKLWTLAGPTVRTTDDAGNYRELTLPAMPGRRDDGDLTVWPGEPVD